MLRVGASHSHLGDPTQTQTHAYELVYCLGACFLPTSSQFRSLVLAKAIRTSTPAHERNSPRATLASPLSTSPLELVSESEAWFAARARCRERAGPYSTALDGAWCMRCAVRSCSLAAPDWIGSHRDAKERLARLALPGRSLSVFFHSD